LSVSINYELEKSRGVDGSLLLSLWPKLLALLLAVFLHGSLLYFFVSNPATVTTKSLVIGQFQIVSLPVQRLVKRLETPAVGKKKLSQPQVVVIRAKPKLKKKFTMAPPEPEEKVELKEVRAVVELPPIKEESKKADPPEQPTAYRPPNGKVISLNNPKPIYPKLARRRGIEGVVLLSVQVSAKGEVVGVNIKKGSGYNLLDRAAKKAVERWQFIPAQRMGRHVAATVKLPIQFQLK
jgi:periplasmic protein TonB